MGGGGRIEGGGMMPRMGRIEGGPGAPGLGGEEVRAGKSSKSGGFGAIGREIKSFFQGIKEKVDFALYATPEERLHRTREQAAEKFGASLKVVKEQLSEGKFTTKVFDNMMSMLANAGKVDSQNRMEVVREFVEHAFSDLSSDELIAMAKTDFGALEKAMTRKVDQETGRAVKYSPGKSEKHEEAGRLKKEQMSELIGILRDTVADLRLDQFKTAVNGLFPVAKDGSFDKTYENLTVKVSGGPIAPRDWLEENANNKLRQAAEKGMANINGVYITSEAKGDWFRMDINFHSKDGNVVSSRAHGSGVDEKMLENARALDEMVEGRPNASLVLSSLLNQHGWRDLVRGFVAGDGQTSVPLRPIPKGHGEAHISRPEGNVVVKDPGQIGEAQFDVRVNENDDFEITVNWLFTANGVGGDMVLMGPDNPLRGTSDNDPPVEQVNTMGVELKARVVVSRDHADIGELKFLGAPDFTTRFVGKFKAVN